MVSFALNAVAARSETLRELTGGQFVSNLRFDTQLAAAKKLGLRRARIGIRLYEVERSGGRYDWTATDVRLRALMASGMTPIITLFGRSRLTERAPVSSDGRVALTEAEVRAFADFAAHVAQRYGIVHEGRAIIYEIWNEPNTKTFWGSPPDPEAYAHMAEAACLAIRDQSRSATIVGLAMEGTPLNKPYFVKSYGLDIYREWATRAATPSLMKCVDGISIHPYRREPETYLTEDWELLDFVKKRWQKRMAPLIVNSEWGYSIGARNAANVDEQAALDLRLLLLGTGLGRITSLYQITDGGNDTTDMRQMYGLFDLNGTAKSAGTAVKRLLDLIGDFEIDGVEQVPDLQDVFRYSAHERSCLRRKAFVLWRPSGPIEVQLNRLSINHPASFTNLVTGSSETLDGITVQVGPSPILILSKEYD